MEADRSKMDYLGDGVYAIYDGFGIWLHANSHDKPTDKIYLEPNVLQAINGFYARMRGLPNPEG
jgi:hypothetical protein